MPTYTYKARTQSGHLVKDKIEAIDELNAASRVGALGHSIISIEEEFHGYEKISDFIQKIKKTHKKEFIFFSRQLAALLKSGISIVVAIEAISGQTKSKIFKEVLEGVVEDIKSGIPFSEALLKHPIVFSELFVSMVKVGETGGILDEVLERFSTLSRQEMEIKSKVKSAMAYPIILVFVAVTVVGFLMVNIIPKFAGIFETFDAKLPLPTQFLLGVSLFLKKFWWIAIGAVGGILFLLKDWLSSDTKRYRLHSFILKVPIIGDLWLKIVVARFARTLGILLKSGVPILEALTVTEKVVGNLPMVRVIENIRASVIKGESLTAPIEGTSFFPSTVTQMVSLGEKSGNLDGMLIDVAGFYDQEVEYVIKNLTTMLEPLLLLAMGGMVAFIALSVLLPIFNLVKVFK
jgi:type IV pilus assembly protein PilC